MKRNYRDKKQLWNVIAEEDRFVSFSYYNTEREKAWHLFSKRYNRSSMFGLKTMSSPTFKQTRIDTINKYFFRAITQKKQK